MAGCLSGVLHEQPGSMALLPHPTAGTQQAHSAPFRSPAGPQPAQPHEAAHPELQFGAAFGAPALLCKAAQLIAAKRLGRQPHSVYFVHEAGPEAAQAAKLWTAERQLHGKRMEAVQHLISQGMADEQLQRDLLAFREEEAAGGPTKKAKQLFREGRLCKLGGTCSRLTPRATAYMPPGEWSELMKNATMTLVRWRMASRTSEWGSAGPRLTPSHTTTVHATRPAWLLRGAGANHDATTSAPPVAPAGL